MKVLQINSVCGYGSTGHIVVELYQALERHGHECCIAYGRKNTEKGLYVIKIGNKIDFCMHALRTRLLDQHGFGSKRATSKLIRQIKEYDPDIIHLHNIHGYYINIKILFEYLEKADKPVIWTMHDCWAFTGHCAHYDGIQCMGWKEGCNHCANIQSYPKTLYQKNTSNNYKYKKKYFTSVKDLTIITPSYWLQNQIKNSFLRDTESIVVENGIDLGKFKPTESSLRERLQCENKILLLGVACPWRKSKGLEDFLYLREKLDSKYVICLVGMSEKQIQNLPDGIIGIKRTQNVIELAQYYSASDVFLNLTYEDTFPTTNIEALACGTPVLTYRTGGSPEILAEGCGWVIARGNLEAVVETLINKVREKNYYKKNCLERAKNFDKNVCYEQYLNIYTEKVENRRNCTHE